MRRKKSHRSSPSAKTKLIRAAAGRLKVPPLKVLPKKKSVSPDKTTVEYLKDSDAEGPD